MINSINDLAPEHDSLELRLVAAMRPLFEGIATKDPENRVTTNILISIRSTDIVTGESIDVRVIEGHRGHLVDMAYAVINEAEVAKVIAAGDTFDGDFVEVA